MPSQPAVAASPDSQRQKRDVSAAIVRREVQSKPGAAIEVTALTLSKQARESLSAGACSDAEMERTP